MESAVLVVTVLWLAISFAIRSQAPIIRKRATIRASLGISLGAFALLVTGIQASRVASSEAEFETLVLAISGLGLILSSTGTLRARP